MRCTSSKVVPQEQGVRPSGATRVESVPSQVRITDSPSDFPSGSRPSAASDAISCVGVQHGRAKYCALCLWAADAHREHQRESFLRSERLQPPALLFIGALAEGDPAADLLFFERPELRVFLHEQLALLLALILVEGPESAALARKFCALGKERE